MTYGEHLIQQVDQGRARHIQQVAQVGQHFDQ